eukprot:2651116-Rhodomonas_salina.1
MSPRMLWDVVRGEENVGVLATEKSASRRGGLMVPQIFSRSSSHGFCTLFLHDRVIQKKQRIHRTREHLHELHGLFKFAH